MSWHILDTDTLTLYQSGHLVVVQRVSQCRPDDLALTIISVEEELTGWYTKLRRAKKKEHLARAYQRLTDAVRFFSRLNILSFTEPAIERYEALRTAHRQIGKNDLRIAAITLEHSGTVVTRNVRDFRQVPGLLVEDWSL